MISAKDILAQRPFTLDQSHLPHLGKVTRGKVRDLYDLGDRLLLVTTDRQSAFDRVLARIPFKGQVLNQCAAFWFEESKDIVANHVLAVPDPNALLARKVTIHPVEVVVRAYNTGVTSTSVWTAYQKGVRVFHGNLLPEGMVKNQALPAPILTPTTKSEAHDEPIDPAGIVSQGLMTQAQWDEVAAVALALFKRGVEVAARRGLILVDTKYEFGTDNQGRLTLADEIHTPDSSRWWVAASYEDRMKAGLEPEMIDKEFLRLWFREHCDPYAPGELPEAPEELVVEMSRRYIDLYERITGKTFQAQVGNVQDRLVANTQKMGAGSVAGGK